MSDKLTERDVTPRDTYLSRRRLLQGGVVAAGMVVTGLAYRKINGVDLVDDRDAPIAGA